MHEKIGIFKEIQNKVAEIREVFILILPYPTEMAPLITKWRPWPPGCLPSQKSLK